MKTFRTIHFPLVNIFNFPIIKLTHRKEAKKEKLNKIKKQERRTDKGNRKIAKKVKHKLKRRRKKDFKYSKKKGKINKTHFQILSKAFLHFLILLSLNVVFISLFSSSLTYSLASLLPYKFILLLKNHIL